MDLKQFLKENEKDGRLLIILTRFLGSYIALKLKDSRITPNQVSIIGFIIGIIAAFSFSFGNYYSTLFGSFMYIVALILDYTDGVLARLKNMSSFFGRWLEMNFDDMADGLANLCICLGVYKDNENILIWVLGFFLTIITFSSTELNLTYKAYPFTNKSTSEIQKRSILFKISKQFLAGFPLKALLLIIFAIFDKMFSFLIFYTIFETFKYIFTSFYLGRIIKRYDDIF